VKVVTFIHHFGLQVAEKFISETSSQVTPVRIKPRVIAITSLMRVIVVRYNLHSTAPTIQVRYLTLSELYLISLPSGKGFHTSVEFHYMGVAARVQRVSRAC
jgi:hypothetical protein